MTTKSSIAMCTWNGEQYLAEQLASISAQTSTPDELIVCDDKSSDETVRIVSDFARSAPFPVRLHVNENNLGSTRNFAQAISLCSGDIIALSDQDDIWLPGKLAKLKAEFDRAPNVGLIFTDAEVIDEAGTLVLHSLWEHLPLQLAERQRLQGNGAIDELLPGSLVTGATMAFRAHFKELVLPIPNDLPIIHDAWIAVLLAAVSDVLPLPIQLIRYRQHRGQQIGALKRKDGGPVQIFDAKSMQEALRRMNSYDEALAAARAVRLRLLERGQAFESGKARARIERRITHLETRSTLPRGRLARVPQVLRELITLRYHRCSKGLQSAIKDLLA